MKFLKVLLPALLPLCCAPLAAEEWIIPRTTYYLTLKQQAFPDFPAPPADGSEADKADLAELLRVQSSLKPGDCLRAQGSAKADFENFFGEASPFPSPLPREAAEVLKRLKTETDGVAADVKDRFKRKRPFLREPAVDPCLGRIGGLAYPSGHATISRLFALVLSDLVPQRRREYLRLADEAAQDRVIGGVHHPADIAAGKELAERLYRRYKGSHVFKRDMRRLRELLDPERAAAPRGKGK